MQFLKSSFGKKPVITVLSTMISMLVFTNVRSQQTASVVNKNPDKIQVKYIDGDNDVLYFNLKYNNESGSDFKLMVLNETGDILFQQKYSGKKIRKNLRLPRLTDTDNVTFLIKSSGKNVQLSYKVKVTDKVVDNMPEVDTQLAL